MVVPALVLMATVSMFFLGALVELVDTFRARHERRDLSEPEAVQELKAVLDGGPLVGWVVLALLAVAAPVVIHSPGTSITDVLFFAVMLGFAAERANYLGHRWAARRAPHRFVRRGATAAVVVVAGWVLGASGG